MQQSTGFPQKFGALSLSKNLFFERLTEVKEAGKTNKPNPSAYIGTVGFGLCSKSKCLAKQAFLHLICLAVLGTFSSRRRLCGGSKPPPYRNYCLFAF